MKKNRPVGAELFHAYRRTDVTQLIAAIRGFGNPPKNWWCPQILWICDHVTWSIIKKSTALLYTVRSSCEGRFNSNTTVLQYLCCSAWRRCLGSLRLCVRIWQ